MRLFNILQEIYLDGYGLTSNKSKFKRPENFEVIDSTKEWSLMTGGNDWEVGCTWMAVYFKNSDELCRIWIKIKFPENISKDSNYPKELDKVGNEWGKSAYNSWLTATKALNSKKEFSNYKDSFLEALKSDEMGKYIEEYGVDHTKWNAMEEKTDQTED